MVLGACCIHFPNCEHVSGLEARVGAYHAMIRRARARCHLSRTPREARRYRRLAERLRGRLWREVFGYIALSR